ncbi:MAG: ribonuclease D [Alphaproteobacteria bacterium]
MLLIDPLAPGMDLTPLFQLLNDDSILKVFHAARQDLEIFFNLIGAVPKPIFDTQVAAMVCGFGESVAYDTLVAKLTKARIDKSSRWADWSHRPLTEKQRHYALSDVTHLRVIYQKLIAKLTKTHRISWIKEEMAILVDPKTYLLDPDEAWRRLRSRTSNRRFLGILKELAAWREQEARDRDLPRGRILRDDCLADIAATAPTSTEALARCRGVGSGIATGKLGPGILNAVKKGVNLPPDLLPSPEEKPEFVPGLGPVMDLLKVLLKAKCEEFEVAQKLVANSADIERIAADDSANVPALKGWRRDIFGNAALDLKHGRLTISCRNGRIALIPSPGEKT